MKMVTLSSDIFLWIYQVSPHTFHAVHNLITHLTRLTRLEPRTSIRGTAAWYSGQRTSHAMGIITICFPYLKTT